MVKSLQYFSTRYSSTCTRYTRYIRYTSYQYCFSRLTKGKVEVTCVEELANRLLTSSLPTPLLPGPSTPVLPAWPCLGCTSTLQGKCPPIEMSRR